ncbi:hypothetical protein [Streptomyces sp. NPDC050507]|uniref:hypothetical protein n=1 Tax=Streptomyces sp. NPDC050507 TaxID=3365619 RepID=UPI0037B6DE00
MTADPIGRYFPPPPHGVLVNSEQDKPDLYPAGPDDGRQAPVPVGRTEDRDIHDPAIDDRPSY